MSKTTWEEVGQGIERCPVPGGWLYRTWLVPLDPGLAALGGRMQTIVTFVPAAAQPGMTVSVASVFPGAADRQDDLAAAQPEEKP